MPAPVITEAEKARRDAVQKLMDCYLAEHRTAFKVKKRWDEVSADPFKLMTKVEWKTFNLTLTQEDREVARRIRRSKRNCDSALRCRRKKVDALNEATKKAAYYQALSERLATALEAMKKKRKTTSLERPTAPPASPVSDAATSGSPDVKSLETSMFYSLSPAPSDDVFWGGAAGLAAAAEAAGAAAAAAGPTEAACMA